MPDSPYSSISPNTLIRGWIASPTNALSEVADYDKSRSAGIAGFFSIVSLLASVVVYKIYHYLHTEDKKAEFLDISIQLMYAKLERIQPDIFQIQIGPFTLSDKKKEDESEMPSIIIEDTKTKKIYRLEDTTLQELQMKATMVVTHTETENKQKALEQASVLFPMDGNESNRKARMLKITLKAGPRDHVAYCSKFDDPPGATPAKAPAKGSGAEKYWETMQQVKESVIKFYCLYAHFQFITGNHDWTNTNPGEQIEQIEQIKKCVTYLKCSPGSLALLEEIFPEVSYNEGAQLKKELYQQYCEEKNEETNKSIYKDLYSALEAMTTALSELRLQKQQYSGSDDIDIDCPGLDQVRKTLEF